jgi:archaellum component FlaC
VETEKVEQLELKLDFLKSEYESKSEELNASNEENEKMVEMVAELRCGLETSEKNNKKYLDKMAQYQTSF